MLLRMIQGNRRTVGFLFADLRGYTAFVERQGDAAAADLLHDYRQLVREVVAKFGGAEIKTEGTLSMSCSSRQAPPSNAA